MIEHHVEIVFVKCLFLQENCFLFRENCFFAFQKIVGLRRELLKTSIRRILWHISRCPHSGNYVKTLILIMDHCLLKVPATATTLGISDERKISMAILKDLDSRMRAGLSLWKQTSINYLCLFTSLNKSQHEVRDFGTAKEMSNLFYIMISDIVPSRVTSKTVNS